VGFGGLREWQYLTLVTLGVFQPFPPDLAHMLLNGAAFSESPCAVEVETALLDNTTDDLP